MAPEWWPWTAHAPLGPRVRARAATAALDVKTGGGDAEALKRKADGYALQRSVYVGALEAISGRPVTSFAFHFASDSVQVVGPATSVST